MTSLLNSCAVNRSCTLWTVGLSKEQLTLRSKACFPLASWSGTNFSLESYEFHFDNAHCKHLLLALRHDSGYIMELDTYRGDESTLARTSLMRSSNAVIGRF